MLVFVYVCEEVKIKLNLLFQTPGGPALSSHRSVISVLIGQSSQFSSLSSHCSVISALIAPTLLISALIALTHLIDALASLFSLLPYHRCFSIFFLSLSRVSSFLSLSSLIPDHILDHIPDHIPDHIRDHISDPISDPISDHIPDHILDHIFDHILDHYFKFPISFTRGLRMSSVHQLPYGSINKQKLSTHCIIEFPN
ncbi:hypothetical protein FHG87_021479 [Trinorchestia longiramus]|nr:hypothetical protein FHG87_021479 [Trinorchestia longiramus]